MEDDAVNHAYPSYRAYHCTDGFVHFQLSISSSVGTGWEFLQQCLWSPAKVRVLTVALMEDPWKARVTLHHVLPHQLCVQCIFGYLRVVIIEGTGPLDSSLVPRSWNRALVHWIEENEKHRKMPTLCWKCGSYKFRLTWKFECLLTLIYGSLLPVWFMGENGDEGQQGQGLVAFACKKTLWWHGVGRQFCHAPKGFRSVWQGKHPNKCVQWPPIFSLLFFNLHQCWGDWSLGLTKILNGGGKRNLKNKIYIVINWKGFS